MPLYWDAYYQEIALRHEATLERTDDARGQPDALAVPFLAVWLASLVACSTGLAALAQLIG